LYRDCWPATARLEYEEREGATIPKTGVIDTENIIIRAMALSP
jgi:hypothetical protein